MTADGSERVALVTGGTDGIGKAIARILAEQGICVVVVGSNAGKGANAVRELRHLSGNDRVEFLQADLSLIRNVDALAAQVSMRWPRLHYLVLCAGIMRGRHTLTREGIETNFAVNYLSRFTLAQALISGLAAGGLAGHAARILVISGAAQNGRIRYDDVNLAGRFGILRAVSQFLRGQRRVCPRAFAPTGCDRTAAVRHRHRIEGRRRANQYPFAVSGLDEAAGAAGHRSAAFAAA